MGKYEVDPSYYSPTAIEHYCIRPEKRLIWAVIERAVLDILAGALSTSRLNKREAEAWILSVKTSTFSFKWCCEALDLSAPKIRRGVFWLKEELAKQPKKGKPIFDTKKIKLLQGMPIDIVKKLLNEKKIIINE